MGLDVHLYTNLIDTGHDIAFDQWGDFDYDSLQDDETAFSLSTSRDWDDAHEMDFGAAPGYAEGLEDGRIYRFGKREHVFGRAYSTYNWLRRTLDAYAEDTHSEPDFRAIVLFSDCDGIIGPVACKLLAGDFERNRDAYIAWVAGKYADEKTRTECEQFYDAFMYAFKSAAGNGCVEFC